TGEALNTAGASGRLAAMVAAQHCATIVEHHLERIAANGRWRLSILVRGVAGEPLGLQAWLRRGGERLSETWSYELEANNPLRVGEAENASQQGIGCTTSVR
ncbi:MAG TPA: glucan biosynthesis protein, partial [Steroidobacter sp.]|nr:glucan biosynthesis protein [Steroidobacter sp.]